MSFKPDPNWPAEVQKADVQTPQLLAIYYQPPTGETQVHEVELTVPAGHVLMVKLGEQVIYSNAEAQALGIEKTEEVKEVTK